MLGILSHNNNRNEAVLLTAKNAKLSLLLMFENKKLFSIYVLKATTVEFGSISILIANVMKLDIKVRTALSYMEASAVMLIFKYCSNFPDECEI